MSEDTLHRLRRSIGDRYAVEEEIDRGGMAVVYLARDLKHGRLVAIKVLDEGLTATLGSERFLREIDVIARLQHPNILTLIDSGEAEGLPYYVMPFVEGQSLRARLMRDGALPVDGAVRIACEIAEALGAAHEGGVIHRDIKPGNVLLSGGHAIVADFGIAASVDPGQTGRLTETGVSLGSPAYMSPEQASGSGTVDHRTDIYGLGCILYEMLAGAPPFEGSLRRLLTKKILGETRPLQELRTDVPPAVLAAVQKAMAVDPDERFGSVGDFRSALLDALPRATPIVWTRRRVLSMAGAALVVVLLAGVAIQLTRASGQRALWASRQLAEVERLVEVGRYSNALTLAEEVERIFPDDPMLARLLPRFTFTVPIRTDPPGARVHVQPVVGPEDEWKAIGATPIDGARFPGLTFEVEDLGTTYFPEPEVRVRLELEGYRPRELHLTAIVGAPFRGVAPMDSVLLTPEDPALEGMVRIPGFTAGGIEYADYFMDRYEVTNERFKVFVDAGGYTNREYWTEPVVSDGRTLGFEEAMELFEDRTGRPGPSTWSLGTYPEGRADHPVGGVSWYEAAAYARWAGGELPTTIQWNRGQRYNRETSYVVLPRSNLGGNGPRPVGENRAMTALGVYDMAGNVREWCYNQAGSERRATRGAAWSDAPFHADWVIPRSALDRDETLGFRLVRTFDDEGTLDALRTPVTETVARDYRAEEPSSDREFSFFRRLYDYDPVPLEPVVEQVDSAEHWIREKVTFNLPYGDRGGAAVYLPLEFREPLQVVVHWGHSGVLAMKSIEEEWTPAFDFFVRSGRAVVVPMLAAAYGREDRRPSATRGRDSPLGTTDSSYRDIVLQWAKDVRTTIDYLETRPDLDARSIAFYGMSFGGRKGPLMLAVEPRIDVGVLNVGGFGTTYSYPPEVDPFNFTPRVRVPVLMINGEHDIVFPYETSQAPLFELLGTDPEDKRHYLAPASHMVPRDELIRESLDWLDRYLGVPGGA